MAGENKAGPCISKERLENHIRQQYTPRTFKLREIRARLEKADTWCADPLYCPLRSLKNEFSSSLNSVRLHEYYFENVKCPAPGKTPLVISTLGRDFGSYEEWEMQFEALGLCSRGWVVMGYDLKEGRVFNYIADSDADGVWSVLPLLVLDVYEHAYCGEFLTRREYVRTFLQSIDWKRVDRRIKAAAEISKSFRENY